MNSESRPFLRVVDFSSHLAGPLAGRLLRAVGADVIKIENPRTGDGLRSMRPFIGGTGDMHVGLNAGARSLAIYPRSPHWPAVVEAAVRWADAVLIGVRPVDAEKMGLGFTTLAPLNRKLIYCVISGYGLAGPLAGLTAHGPNADAYAGNLAIESVNGLPVIREGWRSAGAVMAGVFAALGVLAAAHKRLETPQFVHTSLWKAAMWWNWRDLNSLANLGTSWPEYRDRGIRYAAYPTLDGRVILVCPLEQKFWVSFCTLLGLPDDWKAQPRLLADGTPWGGDEEHRLIAARMATRPLAEWASLLAALEIPFAPILTLEEALNGEHAKVNGIMEQTLVNGMRAWIPAAPLDIGIDESAAVYDRTNEVSSAPAIGEQTNAVLDDFGLGHLVGMDLASQGAQNRPSQA